MVSLLRNIVVCRSGKIKLKFPYYEILRVSDMQKIRPDMDIGHRIGLLRNAAGLTQDETVAKLQVMGLEISKSTYAKIETNRMNIKVSELVALSRIFKTDFNSFFADLSEKPQK